MTSFKIRPRFEVQSTKTVDQIINTIKRKLEQEKQLHPCDIVFAPGYLVLKIKKEQQHYWTPQLDLSFTEIDGQTTIRGLFGPNPHVWTLFTMSYLAIATLAFFISIIGFSRWSLEMSAPILWALPILGGLALLLYISSQFGQKMGAEQTFTLAHFFEELLDQPISIH